MHTALEVDVIAGESTIRLLNDDEIAQRNAAVAATAAAEAERVAAEEAAASARASALAKLEALGLTADEAAALIGVGGVA